MSYMITAGTRARVYIIVGALVVALLVSIAPFALRRNVPASLGSTTSIPLEDGEILRLSYPTSWRVVRDTGGPGEISLVPDPRGGASRYGVTIEPSTSNAYSTEAQQTALARGWSDFVQMYRHDYEAAGQPRPADP